MHKEAQPRNGADVLRVFWRKRLVSVNKTSFKQAWVIALLVCGCATTRQTADCKEFKAENIAELTEWSCNCGDAASCESVAVDLEREGGDDNLARAKNFRRKACELGNHQSCEAAK